MSDDAPTTAEQAKASLAFMVTPSQLLQTLEHTLSSRSTAGKPKKQANVMVWGPMGIGKSDICKTVGKLWNSRIVALHLPQYDPTDLKGIPVLLDAPAAVGGQPVGEMDHHGRVKWIPSSYLPQCKEQIILDDADEATLGFNWEAAEQVMVHVLNDGKEVARFNDQMNGDINEAGLQCEIKVHKGYVKLTGKLKEGMVVRVIDKAIIFLDELSAAVPEVQNAALQLVLDKRVGEYDVPPYTPVVAAGNRESDQAFVSPMSMPLANRFMHLRLTHSVADWIEWAMINRVHHEILGYIQWKKSHALFNFKPETMEEGDLGFPTPRSWAMLSDQMVGLDDLTDSIQEAVITGYIGRSMGRDYIEYRKVNDLLPSTDEILAGKDVQIPEELGVGARYALATALCYALKECHTEHYDEKLGAKIEDQPKEWQVAAKSFCDFVDTHLGREMTVLCVHVTAKHLHISFTHMRGTQFAGFAEKYRDILRKTV
jgi:MoxR-like ATPase